MIKENLSWRISVQILKCCWTLFTVRYEYVRHQCRRQWCGNRFFQGQKQVVIHGHKGPWRQKSKCISGSDDHRRLTPTTYVIPRPRQCRVTLSWPLFMETKSSTEGLTTLDHFLELTSWRSPVASSASHLSEKFTAYAKGEGWLLPEILR